VKRLLAAITGAIVLLLFTSTAAAAHPLGNFTVNSFSALRVQPSRILLDHVTDRAEIPTQQLTFADDPVSKSSTPAQIQAWSLRDCRRVASKLSLTVAGRSEPLAVESTALRFPPGAGGLPTSRLTCRLMTGSLTVSRQTHISYQDRSDDGRVGWHEIIARGDQTTLAASDVPTTSVSRALTAYPKDLLSSPLAVKSATLVASPGGAAASDPLAGTDAPAGKEQRRGVDGLTVAFTDLVGRHQLSIGIGLLAVLLALVLGAFHAFAPGHGKTVMAAYLVADRGSLRQVSLIGLSVTATHTLGVLILGVLLSTFATFAPEKVYPWLGVASGLLLLSIGASLLRAAWRRRALWFAPPHEHEHPHDHEHPHGHEHEHPPEHGELTHAHPAGGSRAAVLERPTTPLVHSHGGRMHSHAPITDEPVRLRNLLSMGLAGGLVPSPSALVVLVGAIALHRAWFGVVLVVFYGAGMAVTLVGIGFLLSRLRGRFIRRVQPGSVLSRAFGTLPLLTAGLICVIGTVLAIRGLGQA
jgi:nickel/cobalt transporter (NicO) family protein